ncbi:hypothetical protein AGLY_001393 [Aphis glycines]|uniref:Uncharacterized protein n=1 Tax=Aphis glycines TaxID=307491 RepID=A0A6G0U559_APHGL|nr:hypothetical protein AGLY_001393 [Aphis glycines]
MNNNFVESYNSVVAKFVGGKRVKYSLRGSYNTRCMTTVSSFNFGPEYMRKLFKQATKKSPGKFTKRFISKLLKNKTYARTSKNRLNFEQKQLQSKKFAGPDTDYGDLYNELGCEELSLSAEGVEEKKLEFLTSLIKSVEEIHEVERATIEQSQLHVANKQICYFVVWTPKEKTERDDKFWTTKMESQLVQFYKKYLVAEKVQPNILI